MKDKICGNLLIIGGAEDKKDDCIILRHFVESAGGISAKICILTVASEIEEEVGKIYLDTFRKMGCNFAEVIHIKNRQQAEDNEKIKKIHDAGGIFFTGGDQLRITGLIGGTATERVVKEAYYQKKIIAGTSAGASAMSDTMIIGSNSNIPEKDSVKMAPGLGLLGGVVIDQHFSQRGRIGRLLLAIATNPRILGVGIDEDTAVHIRDDGVLEVLGTGTAMIIDASPATVSNISDTEEQRPLALSPVKLHVLSEGCVYSLSKRMIIKD